MRKEAYSGVRLVTGFIGISNGTVSLEQSYLFINTIFLNLTRLVLQNNKKKNPNTQKHQSVNLKEDVCLGSASLKSRTTMNFLPVTPGLSLKRIKYKSSFKEQKTFELYQLLSACTRNDESISFTLYVARQTTHSGTECYCS